jgi:hypothetical protein
VIGVLVINGFKIRNRDDVSVVMSDDAALQTFFNEVKIPMTKKHVYDFLPYGQTPFKIPLPPITTPLNEISGNYTPISIVFSELFTKLFTNNSFSGVDALVKGNVIATGLHEIAHAWYMYGTINYEIAATDNVGSHNAYVYDKNPVIAKNCLMRYLPAGSTPLQQATFRKNRLGVMLFSSGVVDKMRNVHSATYHK